MNNDPTAEWNPAYTSELLPLFDVLIDSIGKFDFCEVKHAVVLLSYFCRFVSSSDEDVNQSIRIKYNEWIEEFFSHVPYQTNASILKIQMSAVSRVCFFLCRADCLLKVDQSYPNNIGIRDLVNRIITEYEAEAKSSVMKSDEICTLFVSFLGNYLAALKVFGFDRV